MYNKGVFYDCFIVQNFFDYDYISFGIDIKIDVFVIIYNRIIKLFVYFGVFVCVIDVCNNGINSSIFRYFYVDICGML